MGKTRDIDLSKVYTIKQVFLRDLKKVSQKIANLFEPSLATVKTLFKILDIAYAGELVFPGIDEKGAIAKHPDALRQAFLTGQKLVAD